MVDIPYPHAGILGSTGKGQQIVVYVDFTVLLP